MQDVAIVQCRIPRYVSIKNWHISACETIIHVGALYSQRCCNTHYPHLYVDTSLICLTSQFCSSFLIATS